MDTQGLALELGARSAVVTVADEANDHTENELGNGVGVLARSVHHAHAMLGGLVKVDVVIAGASANYHLELWSCVENFFVYFVAANDQAGAVGNSVDHVLLGAFLHENKLVTTLFNNFADASNGSCSKWFLGCN